MSNNQAKDAARYNFIIKAFIDEMNGEATGPLQKDLEDSFDQEDDEPLTIEKINAKLDHLMEKHGVPPC